MHRLVQRCFYRLIVFHSLYNERVRRILSDQNKDLRLYFVNDDDIQMRRT